MNHIVSRSFRLPDDCTEMEETLWFSLWKRRIWPYRELEEGDSVFWYETPTKRIRWKSVVLQVRRETYPTVDWVLDYLALSAEERRQPYLARVPDSGFCLAWQVGGTEELALPKPTGVRMPYEGWLRGTALEAQTWLGEHAGSDDDAPPDPSAGLSAALAEMNRRMAGLPPVRSTALVTRILRRDTALVRAIKEACDYSCQFPGCTAQIPQRDGGNYVEVAHVLPVSQGGRSVLGNLLVLCPNHHKEFDLGHLEVLQAGPRELWGRLNGQDFVIELKVPTP